MKKRNRSFILILLAASMLAGCGNTDTEVTKDDSTSETTPAVTEQASNLPDKDWGGETFTLISQAQDSVRWATVTFTVEEQNGDIINDEIYKRNSRVSEKYGFNIETVILENASEVISAIQRVSRSGEPECHAALASYNAQNTLAMDGLYMDLGKVPYIELERGIWDQALLDNVRINDTSYMLTGDLLLSDKDCVLTTIYNKALAEDFGISVSDFYDTVRNGKWTFDKLTEYGKMVSADLNGDTFYDYQDRYGLLTNLNDTSGNASVAFIIACGAQFCGINNEGVPVFMPDESKFIAAMKAAAKLLDPKNLISISYSGSFPGLTARQAIVTWFNNKQALFTAVGLSAGAQYMRDCEVDFGYLPVPKYDEAQKKYISHIDTRCPVLGIPVVNSGAEFAGFVLEALCEDSGDLMTEYFETCFSKKYVPDEESYEMLRIAVDNRRYDIGLVFDFGSMISKIDTSVKKNDGTFASTIEAMRPSVEKAIDQFVKLTEN